MLTIFDRLVEELRAWHLFNDNRDYSLRWELPGASLAERGEPARHHRELLVTPGPRVQR